MFQAIIDFILSLFKLFVKFLSSIEINLFGFTFSFYSFVLASTLILVFVSGFIAIISKAGSSFVNSIHAISRHSDSTRSNRKSDKNDVNSSKKSS